MNETLEDDEMRWLEAIAGRPDPSADAATNRQALVVREGLQRRARAINQSVPEAGSALFEKLRFRLKSEGLASKVSVWKTSYFWAVAATVLLGVGVSLQLISVFQGRAGDRILTADSFATVLVAEDPEKRLTEIVKGLSMPSGMGVDLGAGAGSSFAVAPHIGVVPEGIATTARLAAWLAAKERRRNIERSVVEIGPDQLMVTIEATEEVESYLRSEGIEPKVTDDGKIILIVVPK